ncbi:GNAT family N-acetyltransferase [Streptomyces sp. NPDC058052]|uniref:GNAT family N-acetyltransferase n=1 Tax=Streptomyces sp. NPDC058052 TaxID=3346316 RepID=UPI0036EDFF59
MSESSDVYGAAVVLRPAVPADVPALAAVRATPEVRARWRGGDDLAGEVAADLEDPGTRCLTIRHEGRIVGMIQWYSEDEPDYRHAGIDLFLDPSVHGRGLGTDAVRALARHLVDDHGFHRLVIDPAADNAAAIRCYEKAGFRPVGVMRQYERGEDGTWHDGLLMDLLAAELVR